MTELRLGGEDLRRIVREVLRDVLPAVLADEPRPTSTPGPAASERTPTDEVVVLRDDADLHTFIRRVLALADDPRTRADLYSGRHRFRLGVGAEPAGVGSTGSPAGPPAGVHRLERGAVTEHRVKEAAAAGARLVLGPGAVLTPLARDKARALGVVVEKER